MESSNSLKSEAAKLPLDSAANFSREASQLLHTPSNYSKLILSVLQSLIITFSRMHFFYSFEATVPTLPGRACALPRG